jgi:hypothetical protein
VSDPHRVFRDDPSRQETLKILWPELYNALAELDTASKVILCALHFAPIGSAEWQARPPAVGRISDEYGPPACRGCITRIHGADHSGWPLKLERKARR